jgi:hypothetical protein
VSATTTRDAIATPVSPTASFTSATTQVVSVVAQCDNGADECTNKKRRLELMSPPELVVAGDAKVGSDFTESRCLAWFQLTPGSRLPVNEWPLQPSPVDNAPESIVVQPQHVAHTGSGAGVLCIIDGPSGLGISVSSSEDPSYTGEDRSFTSVDDVKFISALSRRVLLGGFLFVLSKYTLNLQLRTQEHKSESGTRSGSGRAILCPPLLMLAQCLGQPGCGADSPDGSPGTTSLAKLKKTGFATAYADAKDHLLTDKRLFKGWVSRTEDFVFKVQIG